MPEDDGRDLPVLVLQAAAQVVDHVQRAVEARGFADVRPAHGFAFARISAGDATVMEVAAHLGVTKQAASQLVQHLVTRGYVAREPDPRDGRARLLRLTERGLACTQAADQAARDLAQSWQQQVGSEAMNDVRQKLGSVVLPGPVRPAW